MLKYKLTIMLDKKKRYESILYLTENSCFTNTYVFYD